MINSDAAFDAFRLEKQKELLAKDRKLKYREAAKQCEEIWMNMSQYEKAQYNKRALLANINQGSAKLYQSFTNWSTKAFPSTSSQQSNDRASTKPGFTFNFTNSSSNKRVSLWQTGYSNCANSPFSNSENKPNFAPNNNWSTANLNFNFNSSISHKWSFMKELKETKEEIRS